MKILLVDDDRDSRWALASFLEGEGFEVVEANDGVEGVSVYRRADPPFDVVVTDFQMPRKNGILMAASIRELEPRQPIILMSADGGLQNMLRNLDLSDIPFLQKGYTSLKDIVQMVYTVYTKREGTPQ